MLVIDFKFCAVAGLYFAFVQGSLQPAFDKMPAECSKQASIHGTPIFRVARNGVMLGASMERRSFRMNERVLLHLWVDNNSDVLRYVATCSDLGFFARYGFDLYDSGGHLVLSKLDAKIRSECASRPQIANLEDGIFTCTRNFGIPVAAHSCVSDGDQAFTLDLSRDYDLSPQQYTIHWRPSEEDRKICDLAIKDRYVAQPGDLQFSIVT